MKQSVMVSVHNTGGISELHAENILLKLRRAMMALHSMMMMMKNNMVDLICADFHFACLFLLSILGTVN